MTLWQAAVVSLLAWISGALFAASFRGGFFRRRTDAMDEHAYPRPPGYALGGWHWIMAPATLVQLGLLAIFLIGAILLIVMSL